MNKKFKLTSRIIGVLLGIGASLVYILTAEPTVSWWDCGEYIATTHKLLVGHPPGAPTFQIIGHFFTLLAGNNPAKVAFFMNCMSAICSGLTIMFLYFTIVRLARKLTAKWGELNVPRAIAILGTAIVGALTYTFTDTFWFSAVEGEVYAMSSFFTALVFWCILKWDEEYDNPKNNVNPNRWIVLIAYLTGLSIGVHLLNLLTLPAVVLIIYYKLSRKATGMGAVLTFDIISFFFSFFCSPLWMVLIWVFVTIPLFILCLKKGTFRAKAEWGVFLSLCGAIVLLGLILWGVIPQIVNLAGKFEIFFVNKIHLPFNSGTIIFFLLIFSLIAWGLYVGYTKYKPTLLTGLFAFIFLLVGYSTFLTLVIRSNANPTIDENNPEDAVSLLAYLNREQYGSNPVFYGQSYSTQIIDGKDGKPFYVKDKDAKRYIISNHRKNDVPVYDPAGCMLFPRMWAPEKRGDYVNWLSNRYNGDSFSDRENRRSLQKGGIPTWQQNVKFLQTYQFGYMYWRYFMWNFAGRQNDVQGHGDNHNGNWICGIPFIDKAMVGNQNHLPRAMERPGHNKYYLLPLLLGLVGLVFQTLKDTKNSFIVFLLFIMTGLAIAFYLNMYTYQPRERDYAFAASFYAFSIWVGFGVLAIYNLFEKLRNHKLQAGAAVLTTLICIGLVPCVMAEQNWDDHNRSDRYTALAIAKNYLDSCAPNAILFTLGDNDTFPLWYAQEVEGYRTDVRVCNLSLLSTSWYVDQMKRKAYNSDPLPISMTWDQYKDGTRDVLYLEPAESQFVDLKALVDYIKEPRFDNTKNLLLLSPGSYKSNGQAVPASFSLKVDKQKVLANGTVAPRDSALIVDRLEWNMNTKNVNPFAKAYIMMMDILANNNWERPIYYAATTGQEAYLGLEDYFQLEGFAYRLVPIKTRSAGGYDIGRIDSDILYRNLMEIFNDHSRVDRINNPDAPVKKPYPYLWGGFNDPKVYQCEDNVRLVSLIRKLYSRLAAQIAAAGQPEKAEKVLDQGNKVLPNYNFPYVSTMSHMYGYTQNCSFYIQDYFNLHTPTADKKGLEMANTMWDGEIELFDWYNSCDKKTLDIHSDNLRYDFTFLYYLMRHIRYPDTTLQSRFNELKIDNVACQYAETIDASIEKNVQKPNFDQQAVSGQLQEIHQIMDIAQMAGDRKTAEKLRDLTEARFTSMEKIAPGMGTAYRNFFNSIR